MLKIGHISDLHILNMDGTRPWDFLNKRAVGGLNLLLNRSKKHSLETAQQAIESLIEQDVDHICVTGDLTNLALESEFNESIKLISQIPNSEERVSVIPGNHDYYTREAARTRRFERFFAPYIQSDLEAYQRDSGYPFCHMRGPAAIIGLKSAEPTSWLCANGTVPKPQLEAAKALLEDPNLRDKFKIVLIHHHLLPPQDSRVEYHRRLTNAEQVLRKLRLAKTDLVLHGHNHHFSTIELPHLEGTGKIRICDAGSSSVRYFERPEEGGKFNIYSIENNQLKRIETYLYRDTEGRFSHWKTQTFH